MQIYSGSPATSGRLVTPFWKEKYEKEARKYWDVFYKKHQDKFFKDRHYLDKEWGRYFQVEDGKKLTLLEVGCGAGNTIFPLLSTYPNIFIHACDFSARAVNLVMSHSDFRSDQINAFVCDVTTENLSEFIQPSSVDIVTMIFVLSAVAPEKMPLVVENIKKVLKDDGRLLLRDYAFGDLAQERLMGKGQQISENFYVRGDGTRAYYFTTEFLTSLFTSSGFLVEDIGVYNKQVENRSREIVMDRHWIHAVFKQCTLTNPVNASVRKYDDVQVDLSEDFGDMFGPSHTTEKLDTMEITVKDHTFSIVVLPKEHQHTCKSTGLMLWESAHFMCNVLAENPMTVAGKRVLELGCGSAGVCSMIAAYTADLVVATDGDSEALDLLMKNVNSNLEPEASNKMLVRRLSWGDPQDIEAIKELSGGQGFDLIIGTDVTYNPDAISPLFATARELGSEGDGSSSRPAMLLCHIQRRVDEGSIISTAATVGFRLVDKWINGVCESNGVISSWLSGGTGLRNAAGNVPLSIMYFQL